MTARQHKRQLTPTQRDRRQRILGATRALVARHGYDGMIMRDVAALAEVSPTTLYNLYNTKDELLLAALRAEVLQSSQRASEESDGPGYDYLLRHLHHVARQTRKAPNYVAAVTQALLNAGRGDPMVKVLLEALRSDLMASLAVMADQGELAAHTDQRALATALAGAFWASFLLWTKGLIPLKALEASLYRGYLSLLIPASTGRARRELESRYSALGP